MTQVQAVLVIKPEQRDRWFELVAAVVPASRAEAACQSYILYESVETPNTFVFLEEWASMEALIEHFHSPGFAAFGAGLAEVLAAPPTGAVSEFSSSMSLDEAMAAAGLGG